MAGTGRNLDAFRIGSSGPRNACTDTLRDIYSYDLSAAPAHPETNANALLVQALNIGLNNWSLVFISLSINQLLRSIVPLPVAALSTVFENKRFGWQVWASMGVVCVGAMLASYGSGNASIFGTHAVSSLTGWPRHRCPCRSSEPNPTEAVHPTGAAFEMGHNKRA